MDEEDVLEAARELERMEQIKFAVLERNGKITVIPQLAKVADLPRPDDKSSQD